MSTLRIYSSGGVLQYDSRRPDADYDERNDRLKQLFSRGVFLFYDPDEKFVRCGFKADTPQPRQFYAEYEADFDNTLAEFKSQLEDTADELGWTLEEGEADSLQYFYSNLTNEAIREPPYDESLLVDMLTEGHTLDFGTPDKRTAIELFHFFRQRSKDSMSLAISENGRGGALGDEVDVVITPGATSDGISAIGETKKRIANHSVQVNLEGLRDAIRKTPGVSSAASVAGTLNRSGLVGHGFKAVTRGQLARQRRARLFVGAALVAPVVAVVGFVLFGELSVLVERVTGLGRTARVQVLSALPVDAVELPLIAFYLFIVLMLGGLLFVASRLTGTAGAGVSVGDRIAAITRAGGGGAGTRSAEVQRELEAFVGNRYVTDEAVKNRLPKITPSAVDVREWPELQALRRRHYLVGLGIGAALGGVVGVGAGLGLNLLLDYWRDITLLLLNLSVGVFALGVLLGLALFALLTVRVVTSSGSRTGRRRGGARGRRSTGTGPLVKIVAAAVLLVLLAVALVAIFRPGLFPI